MNTCISWKGGKRLILDIKIKVILFNLFIESFMLNINNVFDRIALMQKKKIHCKIILNVRANAYE